MPRKNRQVRPPSFGEFVRPGVSDRSIDRSVDFARLEIAEAISLPRFRILDDLTARLEVDGDEPRVIDAWAQRWNISGPVLELGVWVLCWGGNAGVRWLDRLWCDDHSINAANALDESEVPTNDEPFWSGDFELRVEGRDLTQDSLAKLIADIETQFKTKFDAWKTSIERRAHEQRLRRTNPVDRTGKHLPKHYEWFVEYHCLERPYAAIAGEGPHREEFDSDVYQTDGVPTSSTVSEAIRKVAAAARIGLRSEGRRGRPKAR